MAIILNIISNNPMQRGKSVRQTQAQALRQVIAQFDLQTQINKIAVRCFNDLLQSNKQAFEYIVDNDKRISDIEMRLTKAEGFAASIQANVNSKVEVTNALNRRLQTFNTEFYETLKQNESLIKGMRKDYDNLVSSTQKNTHELRSVNDQLKKAHSRVSNMQLSLQQNLTKYSNQLGSNTIDLQKQIIEARSDLDKLSQNLIHARAQLLAKGQNFEEISKDIQLYKFQKESIERRLNDMISELETKSTKADVNEMRLLFDSQLVTEREELTNKIKELNGYLKEEVKGRQLQNKKMNEESAKKWAVQNKLNEEMKINVDNMKADVISKFQRCQSKIQKLQVALRTEIQGLSKKEDRDVESLKKELNMVFIKFESTGSKLQDLEKISQTRYNEHIELASQVTSVNQLLVKVVEENNQRKKQLQRLQTEAAQSTIGNEVSNMNGALDRIREEIYQHKRTTNHLKLTVEELAKKQTQTAADLQQKHHKLKQTLSNDKQQNQTKFIETHRRINQVSIEIMNSVQKAQAQAKFYTDQLRQEIKDSFDTIARMKMEIESLKAAFKEQMDETERLNRLLSDKMQKVTSTMTKFKSDITIKVEAIINQQQRRGLQLKQITKMQQDLRRHVSNLTQGLNICLAIAIARQATQEGTNQAIKISSLLEGWVLQIEDKVSKYRGDLINRRKLLWVCLNFLAYQGDKMKGSVIESGKDVYLRMMDEQQIFTARKRTMTKKVGSELPKLHL